MWVCQADKSHRRRIRNPGQGRKGVQFVEGGERMRIDMDRDLQAMKVDLKQTESDVEQGRKIAGDTIRSELTPLKENTENSGQLVTSRSCVLEEVKCSQKIWRSSWVGSLSG